MNKRCSCCGKTKSSKLFYKSEASVNGLQSWCISCHKKRPRKKKVVDYECESCHQICQRVAQPQYKEVLRRKICCRCYRLEKMQQTGVKSKTYKGTKYFPGKTISQWKLSASRRGHKWELEKSELDEIYERQNGMCALSGLPMIWAGPKNYRPSIDRKSSSEGYNAHNVQFVCSVVNIMKNKIDEPEFFSLCKSIADKQMLDGE